LSKRYDAIVVGAGPVGSYAAYRLACLGYKVAVFDQREEIDGKDCCTGIVGKDCLDLLPIERDAVRVEARGASLFSPSGKMLSVRKDTVQAYVMDRKLLDQGVAQRARKEGVEYVLPARVEDLRLADHGISALVNRGGTSTECSARVAVVATGFGSFPARTLGLRRTEDFVLGAQAPVGLNFAHDVEVYFGHTIAPGFFAWLVPTSDNTGLVGLLARHHPRDYLKSLLERLHAEGKITEPDGEIASGGIPLKPLPKCCAERAVVVGDAAGQAKPTTGGGIYYGLLSADMAVDTIYEAVSHNDLSAKSLSRYDAKWRKLLIRELQLGYLARRVYENLTDAQIDHVFEVARSNGVLQDLLASPDAAFDWHGAAILGAMKHSTFRKAIWAMARSIAGP
jgi:digeranylgeranylglycerophospholipid reductase